jgi:hypothetical protein
MLRRMSIQTGTGKTYTMEGKPETPDQMGIIPRSIREIFHYIQAQASPTVRFLVRASYLQIYNEIISDLLKPERHNLTIREDKKRGVFVEGLSEWVVRSPNEVYSLLRRGGEGRAKGSTRLNELSSRSHAVFIVVRTLNYGHETFHQVLSFNTRLLSKLKSKRQIAIKIIRFQLNCLK